MKKPKFILINYQIYPFDVLVCIGATYEQVIKEITGKYKYQLSEKEKDKLYMKGTGRTVMLKSGQTILRLDKLDKTPKSIAILAHETFHAVCFLCNKIGMKSS